MKGIKQIDKYRLTRLIGKGTTAKVYEAVNEKNKNVVAVKEIEQTKLNDTRIMENFKRELKLLSKFKNNNIIKILDLQKTKHNIYLILEYCNGGNLLEYKIWYEKNKKCELNELLIQKILRQLIVGLEYMHKNNSIHRDIKLENILINFSKIPNKVQNDDLPKKVLYKDVTLNDPFEIKIADLGYARELEGTGIASTMCGTPITMAPDVALQKPNENKHTYNNKADLWSLGAITYELLIGRPPFYANNYKDLFKEIEDGKYILPRKMKLSTEVLSFINGLLQFYPEKRMNWPEIKEHPFIKNDVQSFHFLDLETVDAKGDKVNLEMNVKNCDNFLWVNFKQHEKLNMNIDKVNNENMKDPKIKKVVEENKTKNEEILKAIEEEKKKIEEEKKKMEIEKKKNEEKIKKEKEIIKKAKEKNEKLQKLNEEKEKKIKEQTNLNQIKENEINKKLEELKNREKLLEEEKKNNLKLIEDFQKKQKELENKTNSLEEQNKKKEENNKKIKENDNKLQQLKKEIDKLKSEKEELKSEIDKKNQIEEQLKKKEEENSILQNKMNEITIEKDKKILEILEEKNLKEIELLKEKQKNEEKILNLKEQKLKDDLLGDNLKINNENNIESNNNNDNNNNNENEDLEEWEDLDNIETLSVKLDYEINEDNNGFEIIEEYMDNNEFKS